MFVIVIVFGAVQIGLLSARLNWPAFLPGWFFPPTAKPPWDTSILFACATGIVATFWACREPRVPVVVRCALLALFGYALQWAAGLSEGRGIEGIRDRITHSGHAEFVEVAIAQVPREGFLRRYSERASTGELGAYAPSKPPGQLLLYAGTELLSRSFVSEDRGVRAEAMRDLATFLWPLLATMAAFALYALGALEDRSGRTGGIAALLFLLTPTFALITLHADQVFYPTAGLLSVYAASLAARRGRISWALGAGLFFGIACAISFGMIALIPVLAACLWGQSQQGKRRGLRFAALLAGMLAVYVVLRGFGYDWISDFARGMAYHRRWKGWDGSAATTIHFAFVNGLEYLVWTGVPLAVAACDEVLCALSKSRLSREGRDFTALAMLATFVALLFFSKTKGETARLWFFLTPVVALLAARALRRRGASNFTVAAMLLLQFAVVVAMKRWMDFW